MTDASEHRPAEAAPNIPKQEIPQEVKDKLDAMAKASEERQEIATHVHRRLGEAFSAGDHIAKYFGFAHLPPHLQPISMSFASLAVGLLDNLPRNPERTVALRKLLEAKDAAVRAALP